MWPKAGHLLLSPSPPPPPVHTLQEAAADLMRNEEYLFCSLLFIPPLFPPSSLLSLHSFLLILSLSSTRCREETLSLKKRYLGVEGMLEDLTQGLGIVLGLAGLSGEQDGGLHPLGHGLTHQLG